MSSIKINDYLINVFSNKNEFIRYLYEKKTILIAMNAEKILQNDPILKNIINQHTGYADGIGAVWALKQKGKHHAIKIPGSEFWLDIISAYHTTKTFYFIGSSNDVIQKVTDKLSQEFPNIQILGYRNGFFKNDEDFKLTCEQISLLKPDIIFVAQGSPRQEFTMHQLFQLHPALYMGLGGSFDIYAGLKKRAPNFFLKYNLEWFYRLLKEPTRIKRQLILIKFFILLKLNKL